MTDNTSMNDATNSAASANVNIWEDRVRLTLFFSRYSLIQMYEF